MTVETKETSLVWETKLPLPFVGRGKVRDMYAVGKERLLIVTTDRLSAFDVILPNPIPDKGRVLNQISLFWFEKLKPIVPNHVVTGDVRQMEFQASFLGEFGSVLQGRSVLVKRAKPLPVECVVRGYLAGSAWKDYQRTSAVCGHTLPSGLRQSDRLPKSLFTPATKATQGHDLNIDFDEVVKLVGSSTAERIRELSIRLYEEGARWAEERGIIIADTKFEFGLLGEELILIDEVLTPDSSRFWPKDQYAPGRDQPSFDKQIVRNYLERSGWNKEPPAPSLPQKVVDQTSNAYRDVFRHLTGKALS